MTTPAPANVSRRWPIGAEVLASGQVHFRVWAPERRRVELVVEEPSAPPVTLEPEGNGYFSVLAPVRDGALYRYRLDRDTTLYPDPASRFQPRGPFGPSAVVDPSAFAWSDAAW